MVPWFKAHLEKAKFLWHWQHHTECTNIKEIKGESSSIIIIIYVKWHRYWMEELPEQGKNNENLWDPASKPSQDSKGIQQQTVELRISGGEWMLTTYFSKSLSLFFCHSAIFLIYMFIYTQIKYINIIYIYIYKQTHSPSAFVWQ